MAASTLLRASTLWKPPADLAPAVVAASFYESRPPIHALRKPSIGRYVNPIWVLDYTLTAGTDYRVGGAKRPWLPRRARTAHLYPPGTVYWERTHIDRRTSGFLLFTHAQGAGLDALTAEGGRRHGYAEIEDPAEDLCQLIRQSALLGSRRGDEAFWDVQAMLCRAIGLLLASARVAGPVLRCPGPGGGADTLAQRVDRVLRDNLHRRITLAQVASAVNASESTLTHAYRKQTGRSVAAAALDLRIDRARAMLLRGERMKTIAHALGFSDAYHLSRAFKRRTGVPPRRFLAEARGG